MASRPAFTDSGRFTRHPEVGPSGINLTQNADSRICRPLTAGLLGAGFRRRANDDTGIEYPASLAAARFPPGGVRRSGRLYLLYVLPGMPRWRAQAPLLRPRGPGGVWCGRLGAGLKARIAARVLVARRQEWPPCVPGRRQLRRRHLTGRSGLPVCGQMAGRPL